MTELYSFVDACRFVTRFVLNVMLLCGIKSSKNTLIKPRNLSVVKASYISCVYFNYSHRCYVVQNEDFDMPNLNEYR